MKHRNQNLWLTTMIVALTTTGSAFALGDGAVKLPPPPVLDQRAAVQLVPYDSIQSFKALDKYNEPEYITNMVAAGTLPAINDRLPEEPLVFNTGIMPDGAGKYGGVFRHVIGGRPQGWNWTAGLHQGWGGINYTVQECLTRTGPMYMLDESRVEPLPNLAKSWEWSEDGKSLTMNLVKGAKWSDGDPFDAQDIMFHWNDNVLDSEVPAVLAPTTLGEGTMLEKVDDYTIKFTFEDERPILNLYSMAYRNFCPGPSHILEPLHPKNSGSSYEEYINALAPDNMPVVTMGAWVPTQYKSDELVVMRRNPYYWKVDSDGNQLPYMDEMHFVLSTWEDRTVQALAGTGDFSNMETPSIYLEALAKSREESFPARLSFGPRSYTWRLDMNFARTLGVGSDRDMAIRNLNRDLNFRKAVSHALDRESIGQSLVRGPFTAPFAGGLAPETAWFDVDTISYYGKDVERSKELLTGLGFADTDGDGIVNWSDGPLKGENLSISLMYTTTGDVFPAIADSVISMLSEVGIELIASPTTDDSLVSIGDGAWDWNLFRGTSETVAPVADFGKLAVSGPTQPDWHYGTAEAPQELEPFEQELVDLVNQFRVAATPADQVKIMHKYNEIFTANLYNIGIVSAPGALVINKRIKNLRDGVPILAYQWAEDAVIRETFWIDPADQIGGEIAPDTIPVYK